VPTGATPPAAAQTSGPSNPEPTPGRRFSGTEIFSLIAIAVCVLAFAATGVLLILKMYGVL
jgi:hypothetical protein